MMEGPGQKKKKVDLSEIEIKRDNEPLMDLDLQNSRFQYGVEVGGAKKKGKTFTGVVVDTTDVMKMRTRDAGDAAMTMEAPQNPDDLRGAKKFLKGEFWKRTGQKIWKHGLWRDFCRNKEIARARKGYSQDDKFVADVIDQFSSEYDEVIHKEAGEVRLRNQEIANEQTVKDSIKRLVVEYAKGNIDEAAFKEQERRLFRNLKTSTDGQKIAKKETLMHASNFFEIAKEVRQARVTGEFLEAEDFDIDLIYGRSKGDVRTEANFTRAERLAEKLSHTKLGSLVNETTLAAGLSIASSVALTGTRMGSSAMAKILPFIGTAGVSSAFAYIREGKKVAEERRQHAREMAKGGSFDAARMERRTEMETSRYQTVPAEQVINNLNANITALIESGDNATPEDLVRALAALAEIEARIRLSDRKNIDLICYSDTTRIIEERKKIDIEKAKLKARLRKLFEAGKFTAPTSQNFDSYFNSLAITAENGITSGDISAKDRIFEKMKSERKRTAAKRAFVSGLVIGTTLQETMALFLDQTGIVEDTFRHNVNPFNSSSAITGAESHTGLAEVKHWFEGGAPAVGGGGALHEAFAGSHIKLPDGITIDRNPDLSYVLKDANNNIIADHLLLNPDGTFTSGAQTTLQNSGIIIDSHSVTGTMQQHFTPEEYLTNHPGQTHEMHRSWYDNDTPIFDRNELRTYWGGVGGNGIDASGNYILDVSHMTPDGSFHNGLSANAQELLKEGKLKMLLSMSVATQHQVIEVPIGADGKIIVDPASEIGKLFFATDASGHAQFLGRFAEMGQDMGNNNFTMLSTIEGNGIDDIIDTVPTATPETILILPGDHNYDLPPFIPIVPRTPLEKLGRIEFVPYYMNYNGVSSEEQLAQFEKIRSKTLKENPQAKLDHYKEIDDYLKKLEPEYYKKIERLSNQAEKMEKECKLSICIPVAGHQEGKNIYEALENYTYQKAKVENFELVLFVNHPEKDQKGNKLNATETLNEIERFKKDYPEVRVRVLYETLQNNEAKIGKIRKMLSDATLIRQHERGEDAPDLIMVSNDADNKGMDPRYIQTFIQWFENNPRVDGMLGQLDWDPESYQKYPAIHIGTRLFQYLNVIGRRRNNSMISSGANSAYRSSIYAGIGGYIDSLQGGEDIAIGQAIIRARGNDKNRLAFAGTKTRLFTSSRRAISALNAGLSPVEQWNKGFGVFDDEIRRLTVGKSEKVDYDREKTKEEIKRQLEYVINRTLDTYEAGEKLGKDSSYYKKALGWLGINYNLDRKGNLVITDMTSLVEGLKKYQSEGKLMRDARSGKPDAKKELKSLRETMKKNKPEVEKERKEKKANSEELEKSIESFIDEIPTHTQKIDALIKIFNKSLDNKFLKKLGVNTTVGEIKKQLEECRKIESGAEFISKVKGIFRNMALALDEHPEEFAKLKRKIFVGYHNFTPLDNNEIFSYRIDEGNLHIHLSPAADLSAGKKIEAMKDALKKLLKVISSNKGVKEISATSPLVTTNPGLLRRAGFKITGPVSNKEQERDFGNEVGVASRATMSRKEFLAKYSKKTNFINLMKSWINKLGGK